MIGWLRRRGGPVLVCAAACSAIAYGIAVVLPDVHTAEAVVVVPSGGTSGLTPGEATNLAVTYGNLIPEDRAILENTATQLGLDPVTVRENLLVTHDFDTSILRMFYSDADPDVALEGSRLLAQSVAGPKPVSPRIAPKSLSIVAVPTETTTESLPPTQAAVLGLILGLVGGSLLMLAWDRADARVRDAKGLGTEVGCAASSLRRASDESIAALIDRWIDIGEAVPLRLALLAATPEAEVGAERVGERLLQAAPVARRRIVFADDPRTQPDPQVLVEVGGAIGGPSAGERRARSADVIVLVVAEGTAVEELRHALDVLDQFDARVDWALLVDHVERAPARAPEPAATEPLAPLAPPAARRRERAAAAAARADAPTKRPVPSDGRMPYPMQPAGEKPLTSSKD